MLRSDFLFSVSKRDSFQVLHSGRRSIESVFKLRWRFGNLSQRVNVSIMFHEDRLHRRRFRILKVLKVYKIQVAQVEGRLNANDTTEADEDKNCLILKVTS